MTALSTLVAMVSLAVWLYMLVARGAFWRAREQDGEGDRQILNKSSEHVANTGTPGAWPSVVAVVPARNEAGSIAAMLASLFEQDYAGPLRVVVVDDGSDDGTAARARAAAEALGASERLDVLNGSSVPRGWTGKLWALRQGIAHACDDAAARPGFQGSPEFLLLTDADILHASDNVRRLVVRARTDDRVLVSLMARLRTDSFWEYALVPAFVFFFQMLYPFAWVNRRDSRVAAAAGGCMLVRRDALDAAGGLESIRSEIIDDCALGARMKTQGAIWLGLSRRVTSARPYSGLGELRTMVARTAYAQLKYSPLRLIAAVVALSLVFFAPPLFALFAEGATRVAGVLAWLIMAVMYQPMLKFYRRSIWWGPLLPGIAALYTAFVLDSAFQHWRGRGGMWKGRAQAGR